MRDYLGCVKAVDENVGRILDFLDEEKLTEDTLVAFSSDQGFYLGEHGWFDKRWIFEESLRSPLLARWPGKIKPGSVDNHIVSLIDFAETFLDVAGLKPDAEMQGRSLLPLCIGETPADWRKSLYYHYNEPQEPKPGKKKNDSLRTSRINAAAARPSAVRVGFGIVRPDRIVFSLHFRPGGPTQAVQTKASGSCVGPQGLGVHSH